MKRNFRQSGIPKIRAFQKAPLKNQLVVRDTKYRFSFKYYFNPLRGRGTEGIDTCSIFKPKEIESITPIEFIDEGSLSGESLVAEKSTLYAVNYKDDEGYLIVDTNQDKFPIVSFNNKGSFRFNELDSAQKISFQKEYTGYIAESNGEQLNIWSDILDCLNNPELNDDGIPLNSKDSVCVTTIEFQPVDSLTEEDLSATDEIFIYEDIPHNLEATRAIPDRKTPLNRPGIYPMVGIWNLQWHSGNPYNLEMPTDGSKPINVPHISVALGKIMYHHWCPGRFAWMYLPRQVAQNQNHWSAACSKIFPAISDV